MCSSKDTTTYQHCHRNTWWSRRGSSQHMWWTSGPGCWGPSLSWWHSCPGPPLYPGTNMKHMGRTCKQWRFWWEIVILLFVNLFQNDRTTKVSTDSLKWRQMLAITYNVILANQKTESFEYHWLRALAMFDVMSFPPFCRASDIISSFVDMLTMKTWNCCLEM